MVKMNNPEAVMDDWNNFRKAFEGIFSRQYYTENGPLVRKLEAYIKNTAGYEDAICVGNSWVSWLMLFEAAPRIDQVMVPFHQDENETLSLAAEYVGKVITTSNKKTYLKTGLEYFLRTSYKQLLEKKNTDLFKNAAAIIIEFPSVSNLSGDCGGCICTSKQDISDKIRSMRSSRGIIKKVPVKKTVNGRMSEAQAAIVLLNVRQG